MREKEFREKCEHGVHEGDECHNGCDDIYRGARRERRRSQIISHAVEAADRIVMEGSNGDSEETDYLTAGVMRLFMEKVVGRLFAEMSSHDMAEDMGRLRRAKGA